MAKGKRKDRQKSDPDSAQKEKTKRQCKMQEYFLTDEHSGSEDDSVSEAETTKHTMVRTTSTERRFQLIMEGQSEIQVVLAKIKDDLNAYQQYQSKTDRELIAINERQVKLENKVSWMESQLNYMERKQRERNLRSVGIMESN